MILVGAQAHMVGCTMTANTSQSVATGLYVFNAADLTMNGSVLWFNLDSGGLGTAVAQLYSDDSGGENTVQVDYSCVQDELAGDDVVWPGDGNIDEDPGFRDPGAADLRLGPHSPAIDAGDPELEPAADEADLDGHARELCAAPDMGAYESGLADNDCDRDVDLPDVAALQRCFSGSGSITEGCLSFDTNLDGRVDWLDLGEVVAAVTGP